MRQEFEGLSGEQYDELRRSPQWGEYEKLLRHQPDNISSRDYEQQTEAETRKLVAHAYSTAWLDGFISDRHALEAMGGIIPTDHIAGDAGDKMVKLTLDIHSPGLSQGPNNCLST